MHDDSFPRNDVSRDLFKFCEISDNISLTVQNKDIIIMEH